MNRKRWAVGLCLSLGLAGATATAIAAGPSAGGHSDTYVLYNDWSGDISQEISAGTETDQVYTGKWNGTDATSLATRRGALISLHASTGGTTNEFLYWDPNSAVVAGDWNGDGVTTFGVRQNDVWYLRNEFGNGPPDYTFDFGTFGDLVLVGDVDGKGSDAIVLRQGNVFQVQYADGSALSTRTFGDDSAVGVVALGDWDGNGTATPLVRDGNTYHAYNSWNYADGPAYSVTVGGPRNAVIVGDWNGDGHDTIGLRNFTFTAPGAGVQTSNAITTALIESPQYRLRADAAASWEQVIAIWGAAFQINSAWRSYDTQVAIFEARYAPKSSGGGEFCDVRTWAGTRYVRISDLGAAAIPGTSNHGAGTALDINGFEGFDDPVRLQLLALARDFGWSDAEGCAVNERWHFAYNPANDKGYTTWSPNDPINPAVSNCPNKVLTSSGTSTTAPTCVP